MKRFIYILILICGTFLVPVHSNAQSERAEARHENMLLSAVEKFNANDADAAMSILEKIVAEDPDNDAAWYYLAQSAVLKGDLETADQC